MPGFIMRILGDRFRLWRGTFVKAKVPKWPKHSLRSRATLTIAPNPQPLSYVNAFGITERGSLHSNSYLLSPLHDILS